MVGEHIRVLKGGRWIHAVDCGDETVLHLAEESPPARVRRAYRPEFVAGAATVEVVTHRERTFPAKEIVKRAYSRASDPALAAMFHDSEAFAEWCTTGRLGASRNFAVEVPGLAPTAPAEAPAPASPAPGSPPARKAPSAKAPPKPAVKAKAARRTAAVTPKASAGGRPKRAAKSKRPVRRAPRAKARVKAGSAKAARKAPAKQARKARAKRTARPVRKARR